MAVRPGLPLFVDTDFDRLVRAGRTSLFMAPQLPASSPTPPRNHQQPRQTDESNEESSRRIRLPEWPVKEDTSPTYGLWSQQAPRAESHDQHPEHAGKLRSTGAGKHPAVYLRGVVAIRVAVNRPIEPVGVCGLIRSMN